MILFLTAIGYTAFSQTDTDTAAIDTGVSITPLTLPKPVKKREVSDSLRKRRRLDSLVMADSAAKKDSFTAAIDTTRSVIAAIAPTNIAKPKPVIKKPVDSFYLKLLDNLFLRSKSKPIFLVINERKRDSKDETFYLLLGLLLFLAFIKLVFSRYFQNIFRLFFQPTFRQKQTREQLQQSTLPSLLLNLFFVLSAAAYATFLLEYHHVTDNSFWLLFLYSSLALLALYLGKYIFLSFAGWVFNVQEATSTYIFVIYLINKILGVVLIPFTLIMAFSQPAIINVSITISVLIVLLLFLYRYAISYGPVRREIKVTPLHFFFYVFAVEITPLLLIYKTLMIYLNKSL